MASPALSYTLMIEEFEPCTRQKMFLRAYRNLTASSADFLMQIWKDFINLFHRDHYSLSVIPSTMHGAPYGCTRRLEQTRHLKDDFLYLCGLYETMPSYNLMTKDVDWYSLNTHQLLVEATSTHMELCG